MVKDIDKILDNRKRIRLRGCKVERGGGVGIGVVESQRRIFENALDAEGRRFREFLFQSKFLGNGEGRGLRGEGVCVYMICAGKHTGEGHS